YSLGIIGYQITIKFIPIYRDLVLSLGMLVLRCACPLRVFQITLYWRALEN
ncbi:unnamed protein product, partial [Rotaria sp. Silwood2]